MTTESEQPTPDYSAVRAELQAKLDKLVTRVEGIDTDLSEAVNEDWEERATEQEEDEVLAGLGNVTMREINQIKEALHAIEQGSYGICARCGTHIDPARLEILPFATTCIKCA
ncbi:RNA polymerase-binding transcription factor [Stieleria neptunia]|uniref:RNA polymerase-binding transcription factor n=1 Tax=Stieleria neptunia TaxID=2527979 RepID=A0A518HQK9_9BACT|nr:TraR/DksA family transcriptional regulator [Stieleria neptunia]QDV43130.1 RNA polymerase-binding transcription factor [Stieleria neptunia]